MMVGDDEETRPQPTASIRHPAHEARYIIKTNIRTKNVSLFVKSRESRGKMTSKDGDIAWKPTRTRRTYIGKLLIFGCVAVLP